MGTLLALMTAMYVPPSIVLAFVILSEFLNCSCHQDISSSGGTCYRWSFCAYMRPFIYLLQLLFLSIDLLLTSFRYKLIFQLRFFKSWRSCGERNRVSIDDLIRTRKQSMLVPLFTRTILPRLSAIITKLSSTQTTIVISCQTLKYWKKRGTQTSYDCNHNLIPPFANMNNNAAIHFLVRSPIAVA